MDRLIIADVPRDKYVERCKLRAFEYLDRGDLRSAVAAFVNNMNAPSRLRSATPLGSACVLLMLGNDALGWKALIEEFR